MANGKKIQLYDTTLRDGCQSEDVSLTVDDKLTIAARLDEFGFDYIEGGWPGSNERDAAFFTEVRKLKLRHAKIAAFGSTRRANLKASQDRNLELILRAGAPVATVVGKTWDLHVREALRISREENLAVIHDTIAYLKKHLDEVILDAEHFFDGIAANREFALECLKAAADAGADWICLCDTNGGRLPFEIEAGLAAARPAVATPLGIHCHNDSDVAVANALAAVRHGATQVQGTINGLGERCGNMDLCSTAANLALKYPGYELLRPGQLVHLTELSRYVYETANMNFRPGQPFVGASAFAHKGGMHVHGVRKNAASYEHIDPATVGNERRVLVSELSGKSNIAEKLSEYGLEQDGALLARVLDRVQDLENEGYQFEAAEASFVLLVERLAGRHHAAFEVLGYH